MLLSKQIRASGKELKEETERKQTEVEEAMNIEEEEYDL